MEQRNYFIFNNIDCRNYNMILVDPLPTFIRAEKRIQEIDVPGKNGVLYIDTNTYGEKQLILNIYIKDNKYLPKIKKWLNGTGDLIVGTQPNFKYKAFIADSISYDRFYRNSSNYFSVAIDVDPFIYPINEYAVEIKGATLITNIGDVPSLPTLKIYGNGSINVGINGNSILINNVIDYVNVDCEIGAVFKNDISYENNTIAQFPIHLNVGDNLITHNNNVTKIELLQNTKYL